MTIEETNEDAKERTLFEKFNNIKGYYGRLDDFVKPSTAAYDGVFAITFQQFGKSLVLKDETTFNIIRSKLKDLRMMKQVIVMDWL